MQATLQSRIDDSYIPEPNSGCWIWLKALVAGRAYIKVNGKMKKAYRVSYELTKGPIPDGLLACHICDNPACINPDHIFLGTHKDNGEDKAKKKRAPNGANNGNSKLTDEIVMSILNEQGTRRAIAEKYGVVHSTVKSIKRGWIWSHLTGVKDDRVDPYGKRSKIRLARKTRVAHR
jgi:hypothetical protein